MGRTFTRQDAQIASTRDTLVGFIDNTALAATMESAAASIADDLNNIRSVLSYHKDLQTGNWYDLFTAPSALEAGPIRGVQGINEALHAVEKKRVLRCVWGLNSIAGGAGQGVALGAGELPGNTTAAVGAVSTLGTVVAAATTFGTYSATDVVVGGTAISPYNLVPLVDAVTRDPILDAGDRIYGLLQTENAVDGHTITDTAPNRAQISFVKISGGTSLTLISAGAMNGVNFDYCYNERVRLEDLNEGDFLGGANVDVPAGATVTRQQGYINQGATPVDVTTNSILDLESPGIAWQIRDDAEAALLTVTEGSAGGTSTIQVGAAVDNYDNDALDNDFAAGVKTNTSGTRPIHVGVNDGVIETPDAGDDLEIRAGNELFLDDVNQTGSTWAQTQGIKLSEDTTEWDAFETNFGEVSLLNAINQAFSGQVRTKVQSILTSNVSANTDVNGPGTPHANADTDLAPFDNVTFVDDVEVYLNGELLRNDASSGGSNDVYPGGTPAEGDLAFNFNLRGVGNNPDQLTVIVNGQ